MSPAPWSAQHWCHDYARELAGSAYISHGCVDAQPSCLHTWHACICTPVYMYTRAVGLVQVVDSLLHGPENLGSAAFFFCPSSL